MAKVLNFRLCRILRPQIRQIISVPIEAIEPEEVEKIAAHPTKSQVVISCKNKKFNFFSNQVYNNLDNIPLASKGWKHSKSKGDSFVVHPIVEEYDQEMIDIKSLELDQSIIDGLQSMNITKLTDFQRRTLEKFHDGNLLLAAETGCGKTLSYLIPIMKSLLDKRTNELNTPSAIVLVPNRELAAQIGEVAENLVGDYLRVKTVIGGHTKKLMMNPDFAEIDILVATPGALGKLATVGLYKLHNVLHTVLDEADTLIDDSFTERITGLLKRVPQSQIVLVSATLPRNLPQYLQPIESNLIHITSPRLHKPLLNITQKFIRLPRSIKPAYMLEIAKNNKQPLLVFTNRNDTCHWLFKFLNENGVKCANIHGDMQYEVRIREWNSFIKGESKILAATDVGSRGLNTTQIKHLVNYDFPLYAADYLHRIGRIGRIGSLKNCKATNFISGPEEVELVQNIELAIRKRQALDNVDGNITNIVQRKIERQMRDIIP